MVDKSVTLYMGYSGKTTDVFVKQFDTAWRFIFGIEYNGTQWQIPPDATASINGVKPDGNVFSFPGSVENNTIVVDCDIQMTAVAGQTICDLSVMSSGRVVATANFRLLVEAVPKSPDGVQSKSALPVYEMMVEAMSDLTDNIQDSVDEFFENHPEAVESNVGSKVNDWLDSHPEATTTVLDGSITESKLGSSLMQKINPPVSGVFGGGGPGTLFFDVVPNPDHPLGLIEQSSYFPENVFVVNKQGVNNTVYRDKQTNKLYISLALKNNSDENEIPASTDLVYLPEITSVYSSVLLRGVLFVSLDSSGTVSGIGGGSIRFNRSRNLFYDSANNVVPILFTSAIQSTIPIPAGGTMLIQGEFSSAVCRSPLLNRGSYDVSLGEKICSYFLNGYPSDSYSGTEHYRWSEGGFYYSQDNSYRLDPTYQDPEHDNKPVTDCSGMIYIAYRLAGLRPGSGKVGVPYFCDGTVLSYAPIGQPLDTSPGLPGDIIVYSNKNAAYNDQSFDRFIHATLYAGNNVTYEMSLDYPQSEEQAEPKRTILDGYGPYRILTSASQYRMDSRARYLVRLL